MRIVTMVCIYTNTQYKVSSKCSTPQENTSPIMADNFTAAEMQRFDSKLQGKYIPLAFAGAGTCGEVFMAIPKKNSLKNGKLTTKTADIRRQICAVKIAVHPERSEYITPHPSFAREIAVLKQLTENKTKSSVRLPELIDCMSTGQAETSEPTWFCMTAVPGFQMMRLEDIAQDICQPLPQALVAHAYLQLQKAVDFLHTRKVPITKGDMQSLNVMVDAARLESTGFPDFVLIDFGSSTVGATAKDCDAEWMWFCVMLNNFATCGKMGLPELADAQSDKDWDYFVTATGEVWLDCCDLDSAGWVKFLDRLTSIAEKAKKNTSEEARECIHRKVSACNNLWNKMLSDKQILDALRNDS